jgi:hypothetical protein
MFESESVQRVADEIVNAARSHGLDEIEHFGELLDSFEVACSRVFGRSVRHLARQEELRLIREIHNAVVKNEESERLEELRKRAMTVVLARGHWNFNHTVNHLAELLLHDAAPAPDGVSAEIEGETENVG